MFSYGSQCSGVTVPWGPKKAFPRSQVHSGGHFVLLSGGSISQVRWFLLGIHQVIFLKGCVKIDRWYTDYYICVYIIFVFCNSLLFKWDVSNRIQSVLANPLHYFKMRGIIILPTQTRHLEAQIPQHCHTFASSLTPPTCVIWSPSDVLRPTSTEWAEVSLLII